MYKIVNFWRRGEVRKSEEKEEEGRVKIKFFSLIYDSIIAN